MKQDRVEIRTSTAERKQFEVAALFLGMNVSSFMRMCALEKSAEILKQSRTILLSDVDRDAFLQALQDPPKPNKALKKALSEHERIVKNG